MRETRADLQAKADRESQRAHALYRALVHVMQDRMDWMRAGEYSCTLFDLDGAMGGYVLLRFVSRTTKQAPSYTVSVADDFVREWTARLNPMDQAIKDMQDLAYEVRSLLTKHRQAA